MPIDRGTVRVALVAAGLTLAGSASVAQVAPQEVLLGVSRARPSSIPTVTSPDQVYAAAAARIRHGDAAGGQRALEQLVATHPDSEAASRARRDLAALYAALPEPRPLPSYDQVSYLGRGDSSLPPAGAVAGGWRTSVRPAPRLDVTAQDGLRNSAGDLVFFSEGSAELGARARKALAAQAAWLIANPVLPVVVEGHADENGTAEELRALSAARAQAVRVRLIAEGVAAERITIAARSDSRRVVVCADDSCAAQNRRAVTLVDGATSPQAAVH